jgi:hypothetical protein
LGARIRIYGGHRVGVRVMQWAPIIADEIGVIPST